ncbi:MAG TPA: hypothetical protein VM364_01845 [Vicinamibacterales bacterium]|nr:hypothetical protein [Vicinamibacterales bacterium]
MRKAFLAAAFVAMALVSVRADVTLVQTMTMEGAAAGMMGPGQLPKTTMRIKGMKARSDVEVMGQTVTTITDLAQKQVVVLDAAAKTAQIITPGSVAAGGSGVALPDMDISFKPTGKSQTIEGQACEEHTFLLSLDMEQFGGGGQMPPEAAAMMKGVKMVMNGSMWVAKNGPGAAEFTAFNKAAIQSNLLSAISGMPAGQPGGMDKVMAAVAAAPGIPYLMEVTMTFEGSGPIVQAMQQMGAMKMVQKTTSVSTDAIADDVFAIPEGYTVEKK